jgi:hypothetical protein
LTEPNYETIKGKFAEFDKETVRLIDKPSDGDFIIASAAWSLCSRFPGAMQAKCQICERLIGLSPQSQQYVSEKPDRLVVCIACFEVLRTQEEE